MHFKISYAICFNLDQSKMLSSGNELSNCLKPNLHMAGYGLTISKTTNFRLFQTEKVCRQQF